MLTNYFGNHTANYSRCPKNFKLNRSIKNSSKAVPDKTFAEVANGSKNHTSILIDSVFPKLFNKNSNTEKATISTTSALGFAKTNFSDPFQHVDPLIKKLKLLLHLKKLTTYLLKLAFLSLFSDNG